MKCRLSFVLGVVLRDSVHIKLFELRLVEGGVYAVLFKKLLVGPLLGNSFVLNDEDAVRLHDCGEAVGDHEACPSFHKRCHAGLYKLLGLGVYGACRFIQ